MKEPSKSIRNYNYRNQLTTTNIGIKLASLYLRNVKGLLRLKYILQL